MPITDDKFEYVPPEPKEKRVFTEEERKMYLDENGRFKKGHPGIPGAGRNTKKQEQMEYLHALMDGLPPDAMGALWKQAIESAVRHSQKYNTPKQIFKAIEMMMQYGYGKPQQGIVIQTDDLLSNLRALITDTEEEEPYIDGHFIEKEALSLDGTSDVE